jgi:hypothetical protein
MQIRNYKIIEDRPELTKEQIAAGMNFAAVAITISIPKKFPLNTLVIVGITGAIGISALSFFLNRSNPVPIKNKIAIDTVNNAINPEPKIHIESSNTETAVKPIQKITQANTVTVFDKTIPELKKDDLEEKEDVGIEEEQLSVSFKKRFNADASNAIVITDSIYGPVNVSIGYGDVLEYKDKANPKISERNSAWFKFTIKRDTLLTFHIVPKLKTDDYDFALYKCTNDNCVREIVSGQLRPIRSRFSWNTSQNCNLGLSNNAKDTLFEAFGVGVIVGPTYASALKVKAGETYYLMVNAPSADRQEPEGFMIYFYNYMPKKKANKYK